MRQDGPCARHLDRLLDGCRTASDEPLSTEGRQLIVVLDRCPCVRNWAAVYWLVISADPIATLWQAVAAVDPGCPTRLPFSSHDPERRWSGYHPSRLVLRLALRATQHSEVA